MGANAETVLDLADLTISWKEGLILSLYRSPGSRRWASWLVSHRTGAQTSPLAPSRPFSPCHPASGTTCSLALLELTCPKCGTHTAMKDGWMDGWTAGTAGLYCPSPASVLGGPHTVQPGTPYTCLLRIGQQTLATPSLRTPAVPWETRPMLINSQITGSTYEASAASPRSASGWAIVWTYDHGTAIP